jgi:hypothetical protein
LQRTEIDNKPVPAPRHLPPPIPSSSSNVGDTGSPPLGARVSAHGGGVLPDLVQQQVPSQNTSVTSQASFAVVPRGAELVPPSSQQREVSINYMAN